MMNYDYQLINQNDMPNYVVKLYTDGIGNVLLISK